MTKFIEVTDDFGDKVLVNVAHINRFEGDEVGTAVIWLSLPRCEYQLGIQESYEEIKAMLGVK